MTPWPAPNGSVLTWYIESNEKGRIGKDSVEVPRQRVSTIQPFSDDDDAKLFVSLICDSKHVEGSQVEQFLKMPITKERSLQILAQTKLLNLNSQATQMMLCSIQKDDE